MEIKVAYPPNWLEIQTLNPPSDAVFCFGSDIYNPSDGNIPEDVIFHESVHSERQGINPRIWWDKYIHDPNSRLEEEVFAYGGQFAFIKRHYPTHSHKGALFDLSNNLCSIYGLQLSYAQASNLIRWTAKKMIQ